MSEPRFRIVFNGALTGQHDELRARDMLCELLDLDDEEVEELFSGRRYVLHSGISRIHAEMFVEALAEAGCRASMEPLDPAPDQVPKPEDDSNTEVDASTDTNGEAGAGSDASADYTGDDRRKIFERRIRHRRDPRPGAIIPDRRVAIRRHADKDRFHELLARRNQMPIQYRYYSRSAV